MVRPIGLEPTRRKTLDPKSSASTNFATGARAVAKVMNNILFLLVWSRFFAFQRNILHVQVLILWRSWLCVLIAMAEFVLQSFVAIHSKNREATILEGFGQSKEHHPQRTFGGLADGKQHLGERENVTGDADAKHYHARSERQTLQPLFHAANGLFHCQCPVVRLLRSICPLWALAWLVIVVCLSCALRMRRANSMMVSFPRRKSSWEMSTR